MTSIPASSADRSRRWARIEMYNTAFFDEPTVNDEMDRINVLPLEERSDAWGCPG